MRITVRIIPRVSADGHPFSDVLYEFNGQHAYTRLWYAVSDTPHARANEAQAFIRRQAMPYADSH